VRSEDDGNSWEIPAGLIDPGETPAETAARECKEELGFDLPAEAFQELGHFTYSAVGLCGERIHFYWVKVDPKDRQEPTLDGSPLEEGAEVITVELEEAIRLCNAGELADSKTEIAIRRLHSELVKER
jgi:ADP-ribose pyrophosphatase